MNHKYAIEYEGVHGKREFANTDKLIINGTPFEEIDNAVDKNAVLNKPNELCKACKWWKDSDGAYRRGIGAESQCPINRKEVFEGNGYCYMFKPKMEGEADVNKLS